VEADYRPVFRAPAHSNADGAVPLASIAGIAPHFCRCLMVGKLPNSVRVNL
jgi:hypothetical protein